MPRKYPQKARERGFWRSSASKVRAFLGRIADSAFDLRHGTDTSKIVELVDLEVTGENKERGIRYEPTPARPFLKLMNVLDIPRDGIFVDFGCGKGRVLLMASHCGFRRIVGLDFSKALCEGARQNVLAFGRRRSNGANISIVHCDAVEYSIDRDENVFYLFNPFDGVLLERILDNIEKSLRAHPRKVWLIYHNPVWREVFQRRPTLRLTGEYRFARAEFVVYEA